MVSALWQIHRPTRPIRCRPHKAFVNLRPSLELYGKMYRPTRPIRYRPLQAFANLRPSLELCGKCTGRPGPSDEGLYRPLLVFGPSLGPQSIMANCTGRVGPSDVGLYRPLIIFGLLQGLRTSWQIRNIGLFRPMKIFATFISVTNLEVFLGPSDILYYTGLRKPVVFLRLTLEYSRPIRCRPRQAYV